ncbi:hypothetical protein [Alteromonas sp. S005]|uniref:hypothetical protein n=1 Tax=Alteromonas sp. S005 TaxID=3117400 RepID=UPI002FE12845
MSSKKLGISEHTTRRDILKWLAMLPLPVVTKLGAFTSTQPTLSGVIPSNVFLTHWQAKYDGTPLSHVQKIKQTKVELSKCVQSEYLNEDVVFVKGIPLSKTELAVAALLT